MPVKKKIDSEIYDRNASISYPKNIYKSKITTMHEVIMEKIALNSQYQYTWTCIWKNFIFT